MLYSGMMCISTNLRNLTYMTDQKIEIAANKRSTLYPRYDLKEALDFTATVHSLGSENIPKGSIAAEIRNPINSSAFLGRLSCAKQFGLIKVENSNKNISITSRARRILQPIGDEDKNNALREAFSEPELYRKLIKQFSGKTLPNKDTLGNMLMHDKSYGIQDTARITAATHFISSAEFVGAIKHGLLLADLIERKNNEEVALSAPFENPKETSFPQQSKTLPVPDISTNDTFVFDFGGGIKLIIPNNILTSEAIADGELKDIRKGLKNFAEKFLIDKESEKEEN